VTHYCGEEKIDENQCRHRLRLSKEIDYLNMSSRDQRENLNAAIEGGLLSFPTVEKKNLARAQKPDGAPLLLALFNLQ
jgi:hypothetical protein